MGLLNIFFYFLTMIGIYGILALSLNFHYGFSGLVNFGHVGFFAMGAYASALVTMHDVPFLVGVVMGGIAGAVLGFVVALSTSKLSVHYWAIITLGIGEIVRLTALNEEWLTRGSFGILGIPQPLSNTVPSDLYPAFYFLIVLSFLGLTYYIIHKIVNSPFGLVLKAIREDDDLPLALGKPVFKYKVKAMVIGAMFAGIAGALFAHYTTYISPVDFMPIVTFLVWAMVIIGGRGNEKGPIIGAIVIVLFFNSTRYLKDLLMISAPTIASLRMVAIGLIITATILFRREGLIKEKKKTHNL